MTYADTDDDAPPDCAPDPFDFDGQVLYSKHRMRVSREARRQLDQEELPAIVIPPVKSLADLLSEFDTETAYRIERLAPAGGRVLFNAQYKAGKTTTVNNLVRSLTDGDPFLGRFDVNIPATGIVLIDNELSERTLRRWLRDQNIINTHAVADVQSLRGKVGAFNLLDDRCRDHWARRLSDIGCDYLILDCLRPVLDALGLDENRDVGKFLVAFDALLDEAGIPDAVVIHHMGHAGERARGDSRLQDWPDAIWRLVRENDKPDSARYFSAFGRDVDVPEGRLTFDSAARRLTYAEQSRTDTKVEVAYTAVINTLAAYGEGMSKAAIETELAEQHARNAIRGAITRSIENGTVHVEPGAHGAKLHRLVHPCSTCGLPVSTGQTRHESCPPPAKQDLLR